MESQMPQQPIQASPVPAVELQGAGVAPRFAALLIDTIILGAAFVVYSGLFNSMAGSGFRTELQGFPAFLFFLLAFGYFVYMEWKSGATLGKRALGLQVKMVNGTALTLGASLARNAMRIIDGMFGYLVAAIAVWSSKRNQRLGDMVAGTVVIKK